MKVKVQVFIESDGGSAETVENIVCLERGALQPENLGLTLAEAKAILAGAQKTMVDRQITDYLKQQACCPHCGRRRLRKGHHILVYRTPFGKLRLRSLRLYHCVCQPQSTRTFSPLAHLLSERTAPELLYLETKFSSLMSYGLSVQLLQEVLPIEDGINAATVRNHAHTVGQRIDIELGDEQVFFIDGCERDWEQLPRPDTPLTVGLDGGYIHSCAQRSRKHGWFEVIAGKSVTDDGASKRFAFVNNYDEKPKRRVFEVLKSQGMQSNQGLGVAGTELREISLKELERIKWFLWHGNVFRALETMDDLAMDLDPEEPTAKEVTLLKKLEELETYIRNNAGFIVNYGARWRYGETISTAFVESTVNQVVSKRMVKKQQMRWSQKGAHLLLQVRTRVLNDEFREVFRKWYPTFIQKEVPMKKSA